VHSASICVILKFVIPPTTDTKYSECPKLQIFKTQPNVFDLKIGAKNNYSSPQAVLLPVEAAAEAETVEKRPRLTTTLNMALCQGLRLSSTPFPLLKYFKK